MDKERIQAAVREILIAIGENPNREGLIETPRRVAEALEQILTYSEFQFTTFTNEEKYDEFIIVKDILFASLCEHHLLPFTGKVSVGYLPDRHIAGLSKIVRLVQSQAAGLQIQERMTIEIANTLWAELQPRGVGVIIEAEHFCISFRGAKALGHKTITSAMLGILQSEAIVRQEFLRLVKNG